MIQEAWQDGERMVLTRHDPQGNVVREWRYDGRRRLEYVPIGAQSADGILHAQLYLCGARLAAQAK